MKSLYFFVIVFLLLPACAHQSLQNNKHDDNVIQLAANNTLDCNSAADPSQKQFIIGYGSLMQKESRLRTAPLASKSYAVSVNGIRRGWFAKGASTGFSTTFLGAVIDPSRSINAVMFSLSIDELVAMDKRESSYCRSAISAQQLQLANAEMALPMGQYWIYLNNADSIGFANTEMPLVQSYVDIFISGCFELEAQYQLKDFAKQCINSTTDWSADWVNDRLYPRRPFIHQPKAWQIDQLLNELLPALFNNIRIE